MPKLTITIAADKDDNAVLAAANLLLLFRKLGLHPEVVGDKQAVLAKGYDEWTAGNELAKLVGAEGTEIQLVVQPAAI